MEYDATKLDEVVLALLHFNAHTDHGITRAWKGFDWDSLDRQAMLTGERPYNRPLQPPASSRRG